MIWPIRLTGITGGKVWPGCCWSLTQTGQSQSHLKPEVPCWKQTDPSTQGLFLAKQGYCQTQVAWIPEVSRTSGKPIFLPSSSRCWRQPLSPPYVPGWADTALLTPLKIYGFVYEDINETYNSSMESKWFQSLSKCVFLLEKAGKEAR